MPFDVFSAIGAIVRAEATRTTEPAPSHPSTSSDPSHSSHLSDEGGTAHPAGSQATPEPLQEPTAEPVPQTGTLPPAAPLRPGLTA